MARYVATIEVPKPLEEAFAYLSDFSTTREWDPGVVEAEPLVPGPPDVLEAHSSTVHSLDEIRFEATPNGTRITYDARLELKGLLALADPILGLLFRGIGDKAVAGLRDTLGH